jgi:hypothetical protein
MITVSEKKMIINTKLGGVIGSGWGSVLSPLHQVYQSYIFVLPTSFHSGDKSPKN